MVDDVTSRLLPELCKQIFLVLTMRTAVCTYISNSNIMYLYGPVVMYDRVHGVGVFGQVTAAHYCTDVVSLLRQASIMARAISY